MFRQILANWSLSANFWLIAQFRLSRFGNFWLIAHFRPVGSLVQLSADCILSANWSRSANSDTSGQSDRLGLFRLIAQFG